MAKAASGVKPKMKDSYAADGDKKNFDQTYEYSDNPPAADVGSAYSGGQSNRYWATAAAY